MKSLVVSAMICAAAVGNSFANNSNASTFVNNNPSAWVSDKDNVETFKQFIAFHQKNVDVLWEQYKLAETRIRDSRGNYAELERDRKFFIGVYQEDINNGIRVEESKKAIAEIEARYDEKRTQRAAYENQQIAKLQTQLRTELKKEKKKFDKGKKKYATLVNAETLPLLDAVEQHFTKAIVRAENLNSVEPAIAAR